jgi:hypothetical protein
VIFVGQCFEAAWILFEWFNDVTVLTWQRNVWENRHGGPRMQDRESILQNGQQSD